MQLNDSTLLRQQAFIAGEWWDADSGATLPVLDPATGDRVGAVPDMGAGETERAIEAAVGAQRRWARVTAVERAAVLARIAALLREHREDLAAIMTAEQGKPLAEARGEVEYAASYFTWFAEEARRIEGDIIPSPWPGRQLLVLKEPVGVCAAITPWNFPLAMLARKAAPALAAGCAMVVKPSEFTPFSALALCEIARRAGLAPGLLSCITGNAVEIGRALTRSPDVRKLTFTGSTRVGKLLMRESADTVKRLSLELGGNAPFIVFDDADMDEAVAGLLASKFRNAGQTCVSPNRILVQAGAQRAFVSRLAERLPTLKVARGTDEGAVVGPLINAQAVAKVERLVQDATAKGAVVDLGGGRHSLGGNFFQPTILSGVTGAMEIAQEEIFGPVLAVRTFTTDDEALALANGTPSGLAAYFYSTSLRRVFDIAARLDFGMVGVNEAVFSTEVAPFGGRKESGFGREGSRYGLNDYLDVKFVCMKT